MGVRILSIALDPAQTYAPSSGEGPTEMVAHFGMVVEVDGKEFAVPCGVYRPAGGDEQQPLSSGMTVSRDLFLALLALSANNMEGTRRWFQGLGREVLAFDPEGVSTFPREIE